MIRSKSVAASLFLILALITGSIPNPVWAESAGQDPNHPLCLYTPPAVGLIGIVESFGAMMIDGQVAHGQELLWGGELLQAPADSGARVQLDSVGQVTLKPGAIVRLATGLTKLEDHPRNRVLMAALISGEVVVKLQPAAGAYLLADGSAFTASNGANFRVGARKGRAVIEAATGSVQQLGNRAIIFPPAITDVANGPAETPGSEAIMLPQPITNVVSGAVEMPGHWTIKPPSLVIDTASDIRRDKAQATRIKQLIHPPGLGDAHDRRGPNNLARPDTTAAIGPIGAIESFGQIRINGRIAQPQESLWGGELLQASANANVRVSLDAVGQVRLGSGTLVRLATAWTKLGDNTYRRVLIVSLIQGEVCANLQPEASAYIESCGSAFTASDGASFRIGVREGRAVVKAASGIVRAEAPIPPVKIIIRPVDIDRRTGNPIPAKAASAKKRSGEAGRQSVQLTRLKMNSTIRNVLYTPGLGFQNLRFTPGLGFIEDQVPQGEEPVPHTSVRFEFIPSNIGDFTTPQTVKTDARGIATVNFKASPSPGRGRLRVTAEETGDFIELEFIVTVPGFWTVRHALPVFAVAAVGIATGITVARDRRSIKPIPPPVILP